MEGSKKEVGSPLLWQNRRSVVGSQQVSVGFPDRGSPDHAILNEAWSGTAQEEACYTQACCCEVAGNSREYVPTKVENSVGDAKSQLRVGAPLATLAEPLWWTLGGEGSTTLSLTLLPSLPTTVGGVDSSITLCPTCLAVGHLYYERVGERQGSTRAVATPLGVRGSSRRNSFANSLRSVLYGHKSGQ